MLGEEVEIALIQEIRNLPQSSMSKGIKLIYSLGERNREGTGVIINLFSHSIVNTEHYKGQLCRLELINNTNNERIDIISFYISPHNKTENHIILQKLEA
jgi:hypothetical protein